MNSSKPALLTLVGHAARNVLFTVMAMTAIAQTGLAETLPPADAEVLEARAKAVCEALRTKKYDALIDATHPGVFEVVGSKDKLVEAMKAAMAQMDERQIVILEDQLGTPGEVYTSKDEIVCFYPRTMVMQIGDKKVKSTGFMICAKKRAGGEWLFMDGGIVERDPSLLEKVLPGLPKDVKLPELTAEPVK